jgi:rhamnosyltransferase
MHWAMQNRFELAVLFDQDSLIVPGFAAAMLQHYTAAAQREQIGLLSPVHLDRAHRTVIAPHPGPGGNPVTITSGSLLPLAVYRQLGSFVDALFIDEVDTEYCLRIYRIGYRVEVAPDAHLLHLIGDSTPVVFLGKRLCTLTHHSAIRRYYSVRNRIWMIRHYGMVFPRFSLRLARGICSDLFKVALGETEKRRKLAGMLHGAYDGLRGRGGPYSS